MKNDTYEDSTEVYFFLSPSLMVLEPILSENFSSFLTTGPIFDLEMSLDRVKEGIP